MAIPLNNLSVSHLAEEYTNAGVGIRAKARCVVPTQFPVLGPSFGESMAVPNSPVWLGNADQDWVGLILDSVIIVPNSAYSDFEGSKFVKPGMIVDERDPIFGGKKVVAVTPQLKQSGSLWVEVVILRPALTTQQLQAAQALNRTSGGYWMNFWSGSMSSYTKGLVEGTNPYTSFVLGGVGHQNAGLIEDLPNTSFARATPSTHSSNPGSISLDDFRGRSQTYSATYTMPTISGSFVEDAFGALPTASRQTRLSNVYREFTVPDTEGIEYELTVGDFQYAVGGRWRSYTHSSYYGYGGGTEYWYSYFENGGWAVVDTSTGAEVLSYSGTNSHTTTSDSTLGGTLTGTEQKVTVQAGKTYRVHYKLTYFQSSGMGSPDDDMLFIATDTSWSITKAGTSTVVINGTGYKPTLRVEALTGEKWEDVSDAYFVPSATGVYDTTSKNG